MQHLAIVSVSPAIGLARSSAPPRFRRHSTVLLALLVYCAVPAPASACSFDSDCQAGSTCLKTAGQVYGVCLGGLYPGNANDRRPVRDPADPNGTFGHTCSFDTDCGAGSACAKQAGAVLGACLRAKSSGLDPSIYRMLRLPPPIDLLGMLRQVEEVRTLELENQRRARELERVRKAIGAPRPPDVSAGARRTPSRLATIAMDLCSRPTLIGRAYVRAGGASVFVGPDRLSSPWPA